MKKTVLITGATSGIGQACARRFAKEGFNLIITGRRKERLEAMQSELSAFKVDISILCFDVRNRNETTSSLATIKEPIDILINNAGLAVGVNPIDQGSYDDWDRMIDTNVKGLLNVSKEVIPKMKNRPNSHIVNIGSIAGKEVYPNGNVYCASKHAVDAISQSMRLDLLQYGIKVTNIAPGLVETEFSNVRFYGDDAKADSVYVGMDPLTGDDIADAIYYCASRPKHVNIADMLILPSAQGNATNIIRNKKADS